MHSSGAQTLRSRSATRRLRWLSVLCCFLLASPIGTLRAISIAWASPTFTFAESESRTPAEEENETEALASIRNLRRASEALNPGTVLIRLDDRRDAVAGRATEPFERCLASEHDLRNGLGSPLRC